ncbi:MAG TPA: glycoside hydrolase family 2 TIM barrel-domain containing protein, partial [Bacteroidota bacterium]|nr:glycoside hydrolase family 2 TIM barrel-domain containing protein [Bacteroidota bacterium]
NSESRAGQSLNGRWNAIIDPYENGYYDYRYEPLRNGYFKNAKPATKSDLVEYDFDAAAVLHVPGDWNTQRENLFFYEGTVWYKKSFDYALAHNRRLFLHFGGANYDAKTYLNGDKLGEHRGGFTPFEYEITQRVKPDGNFIVVKVDNRRLREGVPTVNTDWWNYGGLTREVRLIDVPETFIRDYSIALSKGSLSELELSVKLDGHAQKQRLRFEIQETGLTKQFSTNDTGYASLRIAASGLELWSPEHPKLYRIRIMSETDTISDEMGFRQIETRKSEVLLNGKPVFLRGISIHEEAPLRSGRATGIEDSRTLLQWAKELGCNYVRLAHYPHNETMAREAERLGLMVWAEIPVYWTILWDNPDTYANAEQQLCDMISRDKNRASIIIWSVANETPRSDARLAFLNKLITQARHMDQTRLISAATELTQTGDKILLDDPLCASLDVIGANEYIGWYSGKPEDCRKKAWSTNFDKPLVISEFGASAVIGRHGAPDERWTEEYQANVYTEQLGMLRKITFLRGMSPWILVDFRSPRRPLAGVQDYYNRKGLISNTGERKEAFYILQRFYDEMQSMHDTRFDH